MFNLYIPFILDAAIGLVILAYGFLLGVGLNIIVAIAEIIIFRYLFKVRKQWWIILLANGVSMSIGAYALFSWWNYCLYSSAPLMMPIVILVLFIITLLSEFPFYVWAARSQITIKRTMLATLLINLITTIFVIAVNYFISVFDSDYMKIFSTT